MHGPYNKTDLVVHTYALSRWASVLCTLTITQFSQKVGLSGDPGCLRSEYYIRISSKTWVTSKMGPYSIPT